ncbi:MAG: Lrp/AsnC family transcriptional regulator, partial [Planctomycetota bacterium]
MKTILSDAEKKVLNAIQHGMPMTLEPYQDLADTIGVAPEQVLKMLREWKKDKRIRRLGAIVNHF